MPTEGLPAVKFEPVECGEDYNFVIHTLTCQPFLVGGQGDCGHGVHTGISDVLHVNWNIPDRHIYLLLSFISVHLGSNENKGNRR